VVADYAEVGQVGGCDGAAAVMGQALVALWWCQGISGMEQRKKCLPQCCRTSMPS